MPHIKFIYVPDDTTQGLHDNKKKGISPPTKPIYYPSLSIIILIQKR